MHHPLVCAKPGYKRINLHSDTGTTGHARDARSLFESKRYNLDVIPIVEGTACLGIVSREELNHHMSTNLGSGLSQRFNLLKRKLDQVVRKDIHRASFQIKLSEVPN